MAQGSKTGLSMQARAAEAELDDARARAARTGRLLGALLAGVGALLAYLVFEGMASRGAYSVELLFMSAWALAGGGVLLALGVGGAARVRDVPMPMWAAFAVVSALIGLLAFVPLGRALASLAGFDDI